MNTDTPPDGRHGRRTLPGPFYRDRRVFEVEVDRVFAKTWFCVGRSEPVDEPGTYLAFEVIDQPVVALRARDGVLRAFHNVCRHRGTLLFEPGRGSLQGAIKCPYHAWTYHQDGRLAGTPHVRPDEINRADFGLLPIHADVWEGCLFVNVSGDAPPLLTWLDGQPDGPRAFEKWGLADLRVAHTVVHEVRANWKVLFENYEECLHCPQVHPELVNLVPIYRTGSVDEGREDYGVSLAPGATAFTTSGTSRLPPLPALSADEASCYFGAYIFPNATLDVAGNFAALKTVIPRAANRSTMVTEYLFPAETMGAPDFDPSDVIDFNELTLGQDINICERVQRGVASRAFMHGIYPEKDDGPHTVDETYREVLGPDVIAELGRVVR
jgi:glycine betaine catabolism A